MTASLDPPLNDFTHTMSSQSLIYNDSSFLNAPKPNNATFQQPISAFTASPPPALSSYSALSSLTPFQASVITSSRDRDPADNQTASPKTPITSNALPFSPLCIKSVPKFPALFALNDSPFRIMIASDTALPPLLDSGSSPVVRRSQGDITPVFGRGGEVINASKRRKRPRETFHDHPEIDMYSMELSTEGHSPSLRKRSTPFLQRLSRCHGGPLSPSTDINPGPCLASPFMLKVDSTQAVSVEKTSPINCTPSASQATSAVDTGLQSNSYGSERNLLGMGSSPLSEASSVGSPRSPIPFDLQSIFEEEDRLHRMKTRSRTRLAGRFLQSTSNPSALGKSACQAQKRKCIFQDDSGSNKATPSNFGSFPYGSFPVKKRKTGGGHEYLTGRTAAPSQTKKRIMGLATDSSTNRCTVDDAPVRRQVPPNHIFDLGKADIDPLPSSPPGLLTSESQRTFPSTIPINSTFPMFYKQFPIPSYFYPESGYTSVLSEYGPVIF